MESTKINKLASILLNYCVKAKENDNILVEVIGEDSIPLANEIIEQASKIKANVFFNIIDYSLLKTMLKNMSEKQAEIYGELDLERMKKMDIYIGITSNKKQAELSDVPSDNMLLYSKYYINPVHINQRVKNTRWCILKYPNEQMAKIYNMTLKEFEDLYFKVCTLDYSKMSKTMDNLVNLMNKTDKVRILGDGTDLSFSIKGIGAEKYVGNFNLPDGEVATAPVKNSINGYITYNTKSQYNGFVFENIHFEFKDGKIIKATSNNTEMINEILDIDEGARYIGEFAFGLNPYILNTIGDVLFDEKVCGSFHLTPGESLEKCGNNNVSAIHWDIVRLGNKENGGEEIYFDDVLVRKDGRFVLDSLKGLNPENLK